MRQQPLVPIDRAKQDIRNLNHEVAAFLKRYPCRVVIERDTNPNRIFQPLLAVFIPTKPYIDGAVPGLVRSAFVNLRAALDGAVAAKVLEEGGVAEGSHFPVVDNIDDIDATIERANVERAGPEVVSFIRGLQPYPGGNGHNVWASCRLGLNLQHLSQGAFLGYCVSFETELRNERTGKSVSVLDPIRCICTNRQDLGIPILDEYFEPGDHVEAAISITLLDGQPLKGAPIVEVLTQCATEVSRVLDGLRTLK